MLLRIFLYVSVTLLSHCASSTYGWKCLECGIGDAVKSNFGRYHSENGVLVNREGDLYTGEVRYNVPNGYGTIEYRKLPVDRNAKVDAWLRLFRYEGRIYEGEIRSLVDYPRPHGPGTLTLPDDSSIKGTWNNGSLEGSATITLPDGSRHSGAVERQSAIGRAICIRGDCANSHGLLVSSTVTEYFVGTFSNRKSNGPGVSIHRGWVRDVYSTTMIYAGNFEESRLINGTIYCIRSSRNCQSLLVRRHEQPEIRVDWVDRIDFFDGPGRPGVADLESVARELLERESPE